VSAVRHIRDGAPNDERSQEFGGSFQGFIEAFQRRYNHEGTALQLVQMVTDTFPSFRDEHWFEGRRIFFWKRAQILVAETWAAFSPRSDTDPHPLFPRGISQLTMFADYRVPQILHHLRLLTYPPSLVRLLEARVEFPSGSDDGIDATREEVAIRAASIVAVERVAAALRGRTGRLGSVQRPGRLFPLGFGEEDRGGGRSGRGDQDAAYAPRAPDAVHLVLNGFSGGGVCLR